MYIGSDEQPGEAGAGICTPAGLLTPPIPTSSHLAIVAGMPSQSQHIRSLTVTVWVQDTVPRDHPDPSTSSGDGPGEGGRGGRATAFDGRDGRSPARALHI